MSEQTIAAPAADDFDSIVEGTTGAPAGPEPSQTAGAPDAAPAPEAPTPGLEPEVVQTTIAPPGAGGDSQPEPLTEAEAARLELADAEADLEVKRAGLKAAERRYADAAREAERHKVRPSLAECNRLARDQDRQIREGVPPEVAALRRALVTPGAPRRPTPPHPAVDPSRKG